MGEREVANAVADTPCRRQSGGEHVDGARGAGGFPPRERVVLPAKFEDVHARAVWASGYERAGRARERRTSERPTNPEYAPVRVREPDRRWYPRGPRDRPRHRLFYALTLHLAATFFIGDVPSQLAAKAALAPAIVSLILQRWGVESGVVSADLGVAVVLLLTRVADGIAISLSYRLSTRSTAPLVALHLAFAAVLGFALNNIFMFF